MAKTTIPKQDPGPCTFCQHEFFLHTGNDAHQTGCAAPVCPEPSKAGYGRCAVYTSVKDADRQAQFLRDAQTPVTITPNELANTVHRQRFGEGKHSAYASCSCLHEAMWLLGFDTSLEPED
jgi:hypothetical protein